MFARSIVRMTNTAAEVAANTKGSAGSDLKNYGALICMMAVAGAGFTLNRWYPSSRHVTDCHGYGGVDKHAAK